MAFVGAILAFVWPVVQNGIGVIANLVRDAGFYRNILLRIDRKSIIPFGLHHSSNTNGTK